MNHSDVIRKLQSRTVYNYLEINTLSRQPTCNFSTCTQMTGCAPINYTSYEQKNLISLGKYYNGNCSTTTLCSL